MIFLHTYFNPILQVVVNDRLMNLVQGAIGGINIGNCEHPCVGQPCLNMGMCLPQKDFYRCSCPLGYGNTNCEESKSIYQSHQCTCTVKNKFSKCWYFLKQLAMYKMLEYL